MRISVIGCGYLGAVHAAAMAELGHEVVGIDVDERKIAQLAKGAVPFFEPGLPELLTAGVQSGRLRFSTDFADAADAQVHFIGVGTPQRADGKGADLRFVNAAIEALIPHLAEGALVVGKSTVPVGTAARLKDELAEQAPQASLAWNPEFLREGFAVKDTLHPDRLVYGVASGQADDAAVAILDEVYAALLAENITRFVTDFATAELVKVSANAFLATKISFINAMAEIAEATGADVTQLADAIGMDERIGRKFLGAGLGFGGGCLPKDIRAFQARAEELGVGHSLRFLSEVDAINLRARERVIAHTEALLDGVAGKRLAVLGLAFKPDSDDVRDSPALDVAARLHAAGAVVVAFDPEARQTSARVQPDLQYVDSVEAALESADAVLVLTEWKQFRNLDPKAVAELMPGRVVIDGRNCLDRDAWQAAGFTYRALGRGDRA